MVKDTRAYNLCRYISDYSCGDRLFLDTKIRARAWPFRVSNYLEAYFLAIIFVLRVKDSIFGRVPLYHYVVSRFLQIVPGKSETGIFSKITDGDVG